jgi:hypothetical protein
MSWDGTTLINENTLTFDAGDPANGSLYLCCPPGAAAAASEAAIERLRSAGLWSSQPPKQVKDEQKPAYAAQMRFVEAAEALVNGQKLVLARYDHAKFPSSAERFAAWKATLKAS